MEQNGYDFSRRKPCDVATYAQQTWDYVITLCPEAEEVQKEMQGVVRKYVSFNFADPFRGGIHADDEQEERVVALYDAMHKELYEFFRSELMEKLLPRCSCGANTYCRCE
ncbi:arsenate reductase domain protein [Bacteroides fragilis str. 3397 T10]|nr:arsenate reductase domain protein [Bacteroides fragilis str. 3397 T10]